MKGVGTEHPRSGVEFVHVEPHAASLFFVGFIIRFGFGSVRTHLRQGLLDRAEFVVRDIPYLRRRGIYLGLQSGHGVRIASRRCCVALIRKSDVTV